MIVDTPMVIQQIRVIYVCCHVHSEIYNIYIFSFFMTLSALHGMKILFMRGTSEMATYAKFVLSLLLV